MLRRITKRERGWVETETGVRGAARERERKEKKQKEKNKFLECLKILSFFSHMHFFKGHFYGHALR